GPTRPPSVSTRRPTSTADAGDDGAFVARDGGDRRGLRRGPARRPHWHKHGRAWGARSARRFTAGAPRSGGGRGWGGEGRRNRAVAGVSPLGGRLAPGALVVGEGEPDAAGDRGVRARVGGQGGEVAPTLVTAH